MLENSCESTHGDAIACQYIFGFPGNSFIKTIVYYFTHKKITCHFFAITLHLVYICLLFISRMCK